MKNCYTLLVNAERGRPAKGMNPGVTNVEQLVPLRGTAAAFAPLGQGRLLASS